MNNHDYLSCPSNLCETDPDKHLRNWFVDEEPCTYRPYTHFIKVQRRLHKLYLKGKMPKSNLSFTLKQLNAIKYGSASSKGTVSDLVYKELLNGKIKSKNYHIHAQIKTQTVGVV